MSKNYQHVGKVQKVHGLQGNLIIGLKEKERVFSTKLEKIYIYIQGTYVPFLIKSIQVIDGRALVKLIGVITCSEATKFINREIFITKKDVVLPKAPSYSSMIGLLVQDSNQGPLGYVTDVYRRFTQPCLCVAYQDDELLIPLHDAFIKGVNEKKIMVQLPKDYIKILMKH